MISSFESVDSKFIALPHIKLTTRGDTIPRRASGTVARAGIGTVENGEVSLTDRVTHHEREEAEANRDESQTDREHGKRNTRTGYIGLREKFPAVFQQHFNGRKQITHMNKPTTF